MCTDAERKRVTQACITKVGGSRWVRKKAGSYKKVLPGLCFLSAEGSSCKACSAAVKRKEPWHAFTDRYSKKQKMTYALG